MKDFHFYIYEVVSVLAQPIHLLKALIVIMFLFFPALLKDVILFHTLPKISLSAKFFVHHFELETQNFENNEIHA